MRLLVQVRTDDDNTLSWMPGCAYTGADTSTARGNQAAVKLAARDASRGSAVVPIITRRDIGSPRRAPARRTANLLLPLLLPGQSLQRSAY